MPRRPNLSVGCGRKEQESEILIRPSFARQRGDCLQAFHTERLRIDAGETSSSRERPDRAISSNRQFLHLRTPQTVFFCKYLPMIGTAVPHRQTATGRHPQSTLAVAQFIPNQPAWQTFVSRPRRPLFHAYDAVQTSTHTADPQDAFAILQCRDYAVARKSLPIRNDMPLTINAVEQSA